MNIGFVINDLATEDAKYTTTRLSMAAVNRGHTAWTIGVADLAQESDGSTSARAYGPKPGKRFRSLDTYFAQVKSGIGAPERIVVDELDVLLLRNDPSEDSNERPWAQTSGILFGQLAVSRGVLVVNDPVHLADAVNKTYFQHFPEEARPLTIITRDAGDIKAFVKECAGRAVLKPLQGSGGQGVFLVNSDESPNVNQIIESLLRDGYVVAQEYLETAAAGDVRLLVMNGRALQVDGEYAAVRRKRKGADMRSNVSAGGTVAPATVTDEMLELVEIVRPKLLSDGLFLVGLDIVGDKLMEVNVFSPGGLGMAGRINDTDFAGAVIADLERKLAIRDRYGNRLTNVMLATI